MEEEKRERFFWSSYPSLAMVYDERLISRENAEEKRAPKMKKGKLSVAKGSEKEIERIFFVTRFGGPKLRTGRSQMSRDFRVLKATAIYNIYIFSYNVDICRLYVKSSFVYIFFIIEI